MAFSVKGIGDKSTGKNEIMPSFDAMILNFIIGITGCVLKNEMWEFASQVVDRGVRIRPGIMQAHGYFAISDSEHQINYTTPATRQYARIYAEINLAVTPHDFVIKTSALSSSTSIPLTQDNLRTNPSGIYQMPLWLVQLEANGTIIVTDERPFADKIKQADNVATTIAGRQISAIFESNHYVKNATLATTATKATTIEFTTTAPTSSPAAGTLRIYVGSSLPGTRYDRVLYLITT